MYSKKKLKPTTKHEMRSQETKMAFSLDSGLHPTLSFNIHVHGKLIHT
jgi:hypothetical protein